MVKIAEELEKCKNGKITPEDRDDALRISNAIAFKAKEDE